MITENMHPSLWSDKRKMCVACPNYCVIEDGEVGICKVRGVEDGRAVYKVPATSHMLVAVEKQPMAHFHPGHKFLSTATRGCQLDCDYCHNAPISVDYDGHVGKAATPQQIVDKALELGARGVAFSHNDPVVSVEYTCETAALAREQGLASLFVTSGHMTPYTTSLIADHFDAVNIDLKSTNHALWRKNVEMLLGAGVWVEFTALLLPELSAVDAAKYLAEVVGPMAVLHIAGVRPAYKRSGIQGSAPLDIKQAVAAAREHLRYTYPGNIDSIETHTTKCECGAKLLGRRWFRTTVFELEGGRCRECGAVLPGVVYDAVDGDGVTTGVAI